MYDEREREREATDMVPGKIEICTFLKSNFQGFKIVYRSVVRQSVCQSFDLGLIRSFLLIQYRILRSPIVPYCTYHPFMNLGPLHPGGGIQNV